MMSTVQIQSPVEVDRIVAGLRNYYLNRRRSSLFEDRNDE